MALTVVSAGLRADEGMWLLPLLQKMNADALAQAGCRLTPEQIYSINHSSLKDAVVQFGGGCTGEIISNEGLLVTNHHCGYSSIQKLSSLEHNYLDNGFWAMKRSEELPVEGLSVTFLISINDVTEQILAVRKEAEEKFADSETKEADISRELNKAMTSLEETAGMFNPNCRATVRSYYDSNVYYLLVYKTYNDVRFVGAPPSSIGKFGADTDNWMWPRHTCDFSMFRVYAGKDNEPAAYSEDNVPYVPAQALKVSLKGVEEGDFAMVMGYPGSTNRFQTAEQLKSMIEQNAIRVAARTVRQDIVLEDMLADPAIKIQYANKYSGSTNGWKKWQGMELAFAKLNIIGRKEAEEAEFMKWVNADEGRKAEFGKVISDIKEAYGEYGPLAVKSYLLQESLGSIELVGFANRFNSRIHPERGSVGVNGMPTMGGGPGGQRLEPVDLSDPESIIAAAQATLGEAYKNYSVLTDCRAAKALLKFYRDHANPEEYCIPDLAEMDIDGYVDHVFEKSVFSSLEKLTNRIKEGNVDSIESDPGTKLADEISEASKVYMAKMAGFRQLFTELQRLYTKGQLQWKEGQTMYPDANGTMRLTYGNVKSYSPKDAVLYKYYTTLDGVMEKEDPDNWEFVVPAKLKELWEAKDYGDYARADGKLPACFLTTNDITGGNSGSPCLDADGNLIGLAFDGNWESMSSDVMFEPDLQRCIAVDIRYVLFIVDKFGGAGYLLDEMDIVK